MVTVRLFGVFREPVGQKELNIDAKNVKELVKILTEKYEKMEDLLVKNQDPLALKNVLIIVNGRSISFLDGINTTLEEEDVVSIFSPIGGG